MKNNLQILLPGLGEQFEFLKKNLHTKPENILIIGASSEIPAMKIAQSFNANVQLIVDDYESLLNSKLILADSEKIELKMMSYDATDFEENEFDLIYAQASISLINRNKIVKEIKRILKLSGHFCVGEVTKSANEVPRFMKDIFESSGQLPLFAEEMDKYYSDRNFKILGKKNLTYTLKDFYSLSISNLGNSVKTFSDSEKSYYKKILNRISHESNVYLKLGGDKYLGFYALLLRKEEN